MNIVTAIRFSLYIWRIVKGKSREDAKAIVGLMGRILEDNEVTQSEWMQLGHKLGAMKAPFRHKKSDE